MWKALNIVTALCYVALGLVIFQALREHDYIIAYYTGLSAVWLTLTQFISRSSRKMNKMWNKVSEAWHELYHEMDNELTSERNKTHKLRNDITSLIGSQRADRQNYKEALKKTADVGMSILQANLELLSTNKNAFIVKSPIDGTYSVDFTTPKVSKKKKVAIKKG